MTTHVGDLLDLRIDAAAWRFCDLRIDIPPASFGSDAINPHTQYSNPVALLNAGDQTGVGVSFTLGAGNEMLCAAADLIVQQHDGCTVGELMEGGLHQTLTNPQQLRWLSPNAGVPLMAAGLVINTLLDVAAKRASLPAWEYLARLPSDVLVDLLDFGHLVDPAIHEQVLAILESTTDGLDQRCEELRTSGLPVYFTTWIGHSAEAVAEQMIEQRESRGIERFKLKIGPDLDRDTKKLERVRQLLPEDFALCVDANQTLAMPEAIRWLDYLSQEGYTWLEEPFAPDNVAAFEELCRHRRERGWGTEVVTGENCPNVHVALALMKAGISRFQSDPCRMFGIVDPILTSSLALLTGCQVTPHAGGSGLDELSPHIQLFNLARVDVGRPPECSLIENVGFSSRFFSAPTIVRDGRALTAEQPGLLVDLDQEVTDKLCDYREGITWLAL